MAGCYASFGQCSRQEATAKGNCFPRSAGLRRAGYAASHRAVREMKEDGELPGRVKVRSSQYLNNLVEQDHRRVKQRIRPMLGFKRFDNAVVTISGIELAEKVKKGQFKTGKLGGCDATMTELWNAALAA